MWGAIAGVFAGGGASSIMGSVFGSSLAGLGSQIFSGLMTNIFNGALNQTPLPQPLKDAMEGAFQAGLGNFQGAAQEFQEAADGFMDMLNPMDRSCLENDIKDMKDMLSDLITQLSKEQSEETEKSTAGGSRNFFEVLAEALGTQVGQRAAQMLDAKTTMEKSGGDSQEDAQEFMKAQSEFQVQSQMFKIVNDMASNIIKTVGEALDTMARKQ